MFKFKSFIVAGLLLGSLAGLPSTMQRAKAGDVHFVRQNLVGKQVMLVFVDGSKFGPCECVYQDGDSIGLRSAGRTSYFTYAQIREFSYVGN